MATGSLRSGHSYQQTVQPTQFAPVSQGFVGFNQNTGQVGETLNALKTMLGTVPATTPFEKNMVNVVNLLIAQHQDLRTEFKSFQERTGFMALHMQDVELSVIKTEQYSRRDCITVTGIPHAKEETTKELGPKVASALSKSGVAVKLGDLSAFHRNGKEGREIKLREGGTKKVPPTVTVKFQSINQKDDVVKNYKNFDQSKKKPAEIQVYHSISPHYANMRRAISSFFRDSPEAAGKTLKWVRYLSPSAGLAVKLKSDEFMTKIHTMNDFWNNFESEVLKKNSRPDH